MIKIKNTKHILSKSACDRRIKRANKKLRKKRERENNKEIERMEINDRKALFI